MLFWITSAFANGYGWVSYDLLVSTNIDLPSGDLQLSNRSGDEAGQHLLDHLETTLVKGPHRPSATATCADGAIGQLTLLRYDMEVLTQVDQVRVAEKEFGLGFENSRVTRMVSHTVGSVGNASTDLNVGYQETVPAIKATANVVATARWQLTDCNGTEVASHLDAVEFSTTTLGETEDQARNQLDTGRIQRVEVPRALGDKHAKLYRSRGVPVRRRYFDGGSALLEAARPLVSGGHQDWDAAGALWEQAAMGAPNDKIKARAMYNLALHAEQDGDLNAAVDWLEKSFSFEPSKITREFRAEIRGRLGV